MASCVPQAEPTRGVERLDWYVNSCSPRVHWFCSGKWYRSRSSLDIIYKELFHSMLSYACGLCTDIIADTLNPLQSNPGVGEKAEGYCKSLQSPFHRMFCSELLKKLKASLIGFVGQLSCVVTPSHLCRPFVHPNSPTTCFVGICSRSTAQHPTMRNALRSPNVLRSTEPGVRTQDGEAEWIREDFSALATVMSTPVFRH